MIVIVTRLQGNLLCICLRISATDKLSYLKVLKIFYTYTYKRINKCHFLLRQHLSCFKYTSTTQSYKQIISTSAFGFKKLVSIIPIKCFYYYFNRLKAVSKSNRFLPGKRWFTFILSKQNLMDNNTEGFRSNCPNPTSLSLTEAAVWNHKTQSWGRQNPDLVVL